MGEEKVFEVSSSYAGCVFLGWAKGQFKSDSRRMTPGHNLFVLSAMFGFKPSRLSAVRPNACF